MKVIFMFKFNALILLRMPLRQVSMNIGVESIGSQSNLLLSIFLSKRKLFIIIRHTSSIPITAICSDHEVKILLRIPVLMVARRGRAFSVLTDTLWNLVPRKVTFLQLRAFLGLKHLSLLEGLCLQGVEARPTLSLL